MMTPKSLAYMIVAVFVGYMLVSAVPNQVAMYATPTLAGEGSGTTITVESYEFSIENETGSVKSEELHDTSEAADQAVGADEQAAEAVAATAATASEADATNAARAARSGLEFMGIMVWLVVDVFVALVVYWFARRRFA